MKGPLTPFGGVSGPNYLEGWGYLIYEIFKLFFTEIYFYDMYLINQLLRFAVSSHWVELYQRNLRNVGPLTPFYGIFIFLESWEPDYLK